MLGLLLCISALATYLYYRPPAFLAASNLSTAASAPKMSSASSLFDAVSKEDIDGVNAALAKGENANALNAQGQAPLHVICTKSFRNANTCELQSKAHRTLFGA